MKIETLDELLNCDVEDLTGATLDGPFWRFLSVRNALIDGQNDLRARGIAWARRFVVEQCKRSPFDYRTTYSMSGQPRTDVLAAAFADPGDPSPTPFLPCIVFALAVDGAPVSLTDDEVELLVGYGIAAISKLRAGDSIRTPAAMLLNDICRVLREQGQLELARTLAGQAVAEAKQTAATATIALADLYDALYDARSDLFDRDTSSSDSERLRVSKEMLAFIDGELAPAIRARNALFAQPTPEVKSVIAESEVALSHRRLTWESAEAVARHGWPVDATKRWLELVARYQELGNDHNCANALSAAIDALTFLVESGAPHEPELRKVLAEYERLLVGKPWRTEADRRELYRRVVLAKLAIKEGHDPKAFGEIRSSLGRELKDADGLRRAFLLSTADDYLGLALRSFDTDHPEFKDLFQLLRGAALASPPALDDTAILRIFVTRFASAIHVSNEGKSIRFVRGEASHELARTLSEVARRAQKDIKENIEKKTLPASDKDWNELLDKLAGRLGFTQLGNVESKPARKALIEVDGLGVHLPLAAPLLKAWPDVEAIASRRLFLSPTTSPPASAASVRILSGFVRNEPWDLALQRVASHANSSLERFTSPAELSDLLQRKGSLIIIGAHGHQDGVAGRLQMQFGAARVPIEQVFEGVRLAEGATVLCCTCFAGSGEGLGVEGWRSMPECLLVAGARAVIANRWPAWTESQTEKEFLEYVAALRDDSVAPSVWTAAISTTRFMKTLRAKFQNPRQWAGWGTWISSDV